MKPLANRFRTKATLRSIGAALCAILAVLQTSRAADKPQIWVALAPGHQRPNGTFAGAADFADLFSPGAPWSTVAGRVGVFKIYPELVRDGSDAELRRLLDGLAARKIALGLEIPVLVDTVGSCTPGKPKSRWMLGFVERLRKLGADLRYLAAVGPLVDGHVSIKPGYCHLPIPDVADDAAHTIAEMRKIYPELQVGEIEPVGHRKDYPDWRELGAWFNAFSKAAGRPPAFLHVDITWGLPWRDDLLSVARQTRAAGIPFGAIYNAEGSSADADYARAVLQHAREVESVLGGAPDHVVFQSWVNNPRRALPESDPATMTGMVLSYMRTLRSK